MSIKRRSRPDPSGRSRGCAQSDRHIPAYRGYLSERGNPAGYVRTCEAALAHLSMWMMPKTSDWRGGRAAASTSLHPVFSGPAPGMAGDRGGDLVGAAPSAVTRKSVSSPSGPRSRAA